MSPTSSLTARYHHKNSLLGKNSLVVKTASAPLKDEKPLALAFSFDEQRRNNEKMPKNSDGTSHPDETSKEETGNNKEETCNNKDEICNNKDDTGENKEETGKKQEKKLKNMDGKPTDKEEKPPSIGNFSLPTSQTPAPFVSFGQRLIGKDVIELNLVADDRLGHQQSYLDSAVILDFGITDNFTTTLFIPYALSFKNLEEDEIERSSGFEDIYLQGEYAFLTKSTNQYTDQATIVANVSVPSGSATKEPPTGFGAFSLFTGITLSRMCPDWYLFTSHGVELPTNRKGTKFGNAFLYQFGLGKNIAYIPNKMIFSWILELDGIYSERNRINGVIDPDSGGNLIYLTPSLWLSVQKFYLQFGIGWAISQQLFGMQNRYTYTIAGNLVWTF